MKKNLLIALALPAMFAACSQEDVISNGNLQAGLLGTPAGEIDFVFENNAGSRVEWNGDGSLDWSPTDAFSLFWVGATGENKDGDVYKSATNALYYSEEAGAPFTSKNIIYEGKHIIVYPANYTHVTDKKIEVSVGDEQNAAVEIGNRTVLVSELLTIKARPAKESDRKEDEMYAGYAEPVVADVTPLSSNLVLNLNFAMNSNINEVEIKSVELEASDAIFATKGNLKVNNDGFMSLSATDTKKLITLVMPEGKKVTKESPKCKAEFALLPPVAEKIVENLEYTIRVNTNFGIVTINKAMLVTNAAGKYQIEAGTGYDAAVAEGIDKNTDLSFNTEFKNIAVRTKGATEAENEASYGYQIVRNVAVDMSTAEINGMKIADSQDLLDAYEVYDLLEKTADDEVYFELVGVKAEDEAEATFSLTPAAAKAIAEHQGVTLKVDGDCTALALTNETEDAFTAVPDLSKALGDARAELSLLLGAGDWALNIQDAKIVNAYKEIHNQGELTVTDAAVTPAGAALNKVLFNEGTVEFSGSVTMPVAYNQAKEAETVVGEEATLYLNAGGSISGNVDVDGMFANHFGIVEINADAEITVAGSFLTASSATVKNVGKITLEGSGTAQVTENENATAKGSIVLADRTSMAKVYSAEKQGYIKWNCEDTEFIPLNSDAFNCLVLSEDVAMTANLGTVKHIEIAGTKVNIRPLFIDDNLDLVIQEAAKLNVVVDANCRLVVPVGTSITAATTVLNGNIEVYGSYIPTTEPTGNGRIYYFNGQVNVNSEATLKEAMKEGALIVLTQDIELSEALTFDVDAKMTLDLNGKTLTMAKPTVDDAAVLTAVVNVKQGELTIKNGTIDATIEYAEEERVSDESKNASVAAVYVKSGATVNIEGGVYKTGSDKMAKNGEQYAGCPVIEAWSGATVNISGGEFEAAYPCSAGDGNYTWMVLNRCGTETTGIFSVTGGKFINYNPGVAMTDAGNNSEQATLKDNTVKVEGYNANGSRNTYADSSNYNSTSACSNGYNLYWNVVPAVTE